jgi:ABC-type transport system substrate-binding protein
MYATSAARIVAWAGEGEYRGQVALSVRNRRSAQPAPKQPDTNTGAPKRLHHRGTDVKIHPCSANPIGSGAFRLVDFKPGEHIVMARFDRFLLSQSRRTTDTNTTTFFLRARSSP